jgi:hypothetical protein
VTLATYRSFLAVSLLAAMTSVVAAGQGQAPTVPVPRPFPGSGTGGATAPGRPAQPAPSAPESPAPVESQPLPAAAPSPTVATTARAAAPDVGGIPLYPTSDYLESYDAGSGQRYVLFGTDAPYETIVTYYKQALKTGGRELYRSPAMHQFDVGRFQDDRMAYPPSVVVKDYATGTPAGFLFVSGATERRYRTIIQIVPPPSAPAR